MLQNTEIKHHSGMVYIPDKKYYVCGARNAWDTVKIGLFDNKQDADGCFPQNPQCVREATHLEIKQFFNLPE